MEGGCQIGWFLTITGPTHCRDGSGVCVSSSKTPVRQGGDILFVPGEKEWSSPMDLEIRTRQKLEAAIADARKQDPPVVFDISVKQMFNR